MDSARIKLGGIMIVCCGEALIDMLPRTSKDGAAVYQPFNGGSIFNTAIALGRLGNMTGILQRHFPRIFSATGWLPA